MTPVTLAAMGAGVFAGAATQRLTGLGFALVASPVLVLAMGGYEGVLVANASSILVGAVVLGATWRDVLVGRALLLATPAVVVVPVGAWVVRVLPPAVLSVLVGVLVLLALLAVLLAGGRALPDTAGAALATGTASAFMNVTAGVGGPAVTVYAVGTGWGQRTFVPTVQLYAVLVNGASLAAKGIPRLSGAEVGVLGLTLLSGVAAGGVLARWSSPHAARRLMLVVAFAGAVGAIAKGVVAW